MPHWWAPGAGRGAASSSGAIQGRICLLSRCTSLPGLLLLQCLEGPWRGQTNGLKPPDSRSFAECCAQLLLLQRTATLITKAGSWRLDIDDDRNMRKGRAMSFLSLEK